MVDTNRAAHEAGIVPSIPAEQDTVGMAAPTAETHSRFAGVKRVLGRVAAFGAVAAAGGAAFGAAAVHLSEAPTTLGPHEATVRLTSDSKLTLDWGSPGKIVMPLNRSPMGEGVYIDIGEVPLDPAADSTQQLSVEEMISQYAGFFANPDRDMENAKIAIMNHFKGTAGFGALVTLLGCALLYRKRRELLEDAQVHRKVQLSFMAAAMTLNMVPVNSPAMAAEVPQANPIFSGTRLKNAYVTGQFLNALTNEVVPKILEKVDENTKFYDELTANLEIALEENELLSSTPDTITLMHTSDKHCNMNVNKLLGMIAEEADVDQVVDTGDSVLGGTPLDDTCTDSNNYYLKNRERIVVEGNHRSPGTAARERKNGAHVLNGKVIKVDSVRYLGGPNQNISLFGSPLTPVGSETNLELGNELADIACADPKGVDIVAGATPDAVRETLRRGCAKFGLAGGRVENLEIITATGGEQVRLYRVGTTGGVKNGALTMGPLQNPATVALIQLDKITRKPLRQQTITFHPDKSVVVGPIHEWTTGQAS